MQSAAMQLPETQQTVNADGTITLVSYKPSSKPGKLIKTTQTVKKVTSETSVDPRIALRRTWARFGAEKSNTVVGPDTKTTQFDDIVNLVMGTSWKKQEEEQQNAKKKELKATSTFKCRVCEGPHMTIRCPYKNTLGAEKKKAEAAAAAAAGASSNRYVPPSKRGGFEAAAAEQRVNTSLRVSNLNTTITEDNLRQLFGQYGLVERVSLLKDRETGESRGMAFIDMGSRASAEKALEGTNGKGFRNLIINVDWSKPKK